MMRKFIGISCIVLGIVCLLASVGLVAYNRYEAKSAEDSSVALLQDLRQIMDSTPESTLPRVPNEEPVPEALPEEAGSATPLPQTELPPITVYGYDCIGILSIPVLELELPVLAQWDYTKLRVAPCQYFGNCLEPNFVIAAHNYPAHFGGLSRLEAGDLVVFTDTSGQNHGYEVVLLETLPGTATEAMITSGFDLSLYTCTPGGASRVTVRCNGIS